MSFIKKLISTGLVILLPFVIATLLLHIRVSELNKFHRKYVIRYLIALLVAISTSISIEFMYRVRLVFLMPFCMFCSSLSTVLWLNVIFFELLCFQVGMNERFRRFSERTRFIFYSLYAWGLPVILFATIYLLHISELLVKIDSEVRAYFFSIPIAIIFGLSICVYIKSTKQSKTHEINEGILNEEKTEEELNQQNGVYKFHMYFFAVIGLAWGIDALFSLLFNWGFHYDLFFFPVDISNLFQGAVIFVWTISRPIILDSIKERWNGIFGTTLSKGMMQTQPNEGDESV